MVVLNEFEFYYVFENEIFILFMSFLRDEFFFKKRNKWKKMEIYGF